MGFNRCYLKKESVKKFYENGGIKAITDMLKKYDAFITEDCSFLLNFTTLEQIEQAEPQIKAWLYDNEKFK